MLRAYDLRGRYCDGDMLNDVWVKFGEENVIELIILSGLVSSKLMDRFLHVFSPILY